MGYHWIRFMVTGLAVLTTHPGVFAQQGPDLPCVNCPVPETSIRSVKPEAGIWRNPEQSGTGFMFEVQNNRIAGYYYLYNQEGTPIWYLFVATLELSDEEGIKWVAEAPLQLAQNGQCLGCDYQPPDHAVTDIILRLEFIDRAYARFRVNDDSYQYITPLIDGTSGSPVFEPQSDYVFPEITEGFWIFAFQSAAGSISSTHLNFVLLDIADPGAIRRYRIERFGGFPFWDYFLNYGILECHADASLGPLCEARFNGGNAPSVIEGKVFYIRPGDISDSRIFGETESGWNMEGFRYGYD